MAMPPEAVWDVLADPASYADWVVGSKAVRGADPEWPAPASKLHHTIGVGPLALSDHTEVLASRAPELLQLRARARPLGTARVTLEMVPRTGGTVVRLSEHGEGLLGLLDLNPLVRLLTKERNGRSLMRLEELVLREAL